MYKNWHDKDIGNRSALVKNMTYWRDKNYTVKCKLLLCTYNLGHLRSLLYSKVIQLMFAKFQVKVKHLVELLLCIFFFFISLKNLNQKYPYVPYSAQVCHTASDVSNSQILLSLLNQSDIMPNLELSPGAFRLKNN